MVCIHCNKEVFFSEETGSYYHTNTKNAWCNLPKTWAPVALGQRYDEKYAEVSNV